MYPARWLLEIAKVILINTCSLFIRFDFLLFYFQEYWGKIFRDSSKVLLRNTCTLQQILNCYLYLLNCYSGKFFEGSFHQEVRYFSKILFPSYFGLNTNIQTEIEFLNTFPWVLRYKFTSILSETIGIWISKGLLNLKKMKLSFLTLEINLQSSSPMLLLPLSTQIYKIKVEIC